MSSALGVVIRDATPSDARSIAEVHVASWRWAYRDDLPAEFLDGLSVDRPDGGIEVAEERGRVVGFCGYGPSRDDDAAGRTAEVFSIYLVAEVAGRGIGRGLLARAVDRLRTFGFDRATLWVMASKDRSRRFYEHAGWSWDGTTSDHRLDCGNVPILRYAIDL